MYQIMQLTQIYKHGYGLEQYEMEGREVSKERRREEMRKQRKNRYEKS